MSKKKHGYWRGRPNEPPLNWHTPDKPVIRKVTGSLDDLSSAPSTGNVRANVTKKVSHSIYYLPAAPGRPTPREKTDLITVRLPNKQWIIIFKALNFYGKTHEDATLQKWRRHVCEIILSTISSSTQDTKYPGVKLALEDWRIIWQQVCRVCQEYGDEWIAWFGWLSDEMEKQIKRV
jgi:hypothetical protein